MKYEQIKNILLTNGYTTQDYKNEILWYIDKIQQENRQLKMINKEYERLNKENGRGFTITSVKQYNIDELIRYEDNWNKLKEIAKSQSGFKKRADLKGGLWFEIDELLDKMQELERGVSDDNH